MTNSYAGTRLQPSLFDRLKDGPATILAQRDQERRALDPFLSPPQLAALTRLLEGTPLTGGRVMSGEMAALDALGQEARTLLNCVLDLDGQYRLELRRAFVLSASE